jgi:DNA-directed RNA polymerase beta subunit
MSLSPLKSNEKSLSNVSLSYASLESNYYCEDGDDEITSAKINNMYKEGNFLDKIVGVPPYSIIREEIKDNVNVDIYGEISLSEDGKLLISYLAYTDFTTDIIENYNYMVKYQIKERIEASKIPFDDNITIVFRDVEYVLPTNDTNNDVPLYPMVARHNGLSYQAEIQARIFAVNNDDGEIIQRSDNKVIVGKIPIMIGSMLDNVVTQNLTDTQKMELGEDVGGPNGYFIIDGTERFILLQQQLRINRIRLYMSDKKKREVTCTITCDRIKGPQIVNLTLKESKIIRLYLYFLGFGDSINVLQAFRMLGYENINDITKKIISFSSPSNYNSMIYAFQYTINEFLTIADDTTYISSILKENNIGTAESRKQKYVSNLITFLFPQIELTKLEVENIREGVFVEGTGIKNKINMLSLMICRLLEYQIGVRSLDNRDSWSNNMLKPPSMVLYQFFSSEWKSVEDDISKRIQSQKSLNVQQIAFKPVDSIATAFKRDSLAKKDVHTNEILPRENILAAHANMLKINVGTSEEDKTPSIRMVQMTQIGYVCPTETPEGTKCGLIKAKAQTCWISSPDPSDIPLQIINENNYVCQQSSSIYPDVCLYNGIFLGWCDGYQLQNTMIDFRRRAILKKDTSILYLKKDKTIYIHTDAGRVTRPLLVIDPTTGEEQTPVIYTKGLEGKNADELISEGAIEYIDAWEQEYIMLAPSLLDIKQRKKEIKDLQNRYDELNTYKNIATQDGIIYSITQAGKTIYMDKQEYLTYRTKKSQDYKQKIDIINKQISNISQQKLQISKELDKYTENPILQAEEQLISEVSTLQKQIKDLESTNSLRLMLFRKRLDFLQDILNNPSKKSEYLQKEEKTLSKIYFNKIKKSKQYTDIKTQINKYDELLNKYETEKEIFENGDINSDISHYTPKEISKELGIIKTSLHRLKSNRYYTHCEVHPSAILGLAASIIPFANRNPAPRNTFQSAMGKQALGIISSNHHYMFPTTSKMLVTPNRPLVETQTYGPLNLRSLPTGNMVQLAIMTYGGYNQEDAIIINKSSIERGLFKMVIYNSLSAKLVGTKNAIVESFEMPPDDLRRKLMKKHGEDVFEHLVYMGNPEDKEKRGPWIAMIGADIRPGQCVIAKIKRIQKDGQYIYEDDSQYATDSKFGIVDRIYNGTIGGNDVINVKLSRVVSPIVGDKFAPRHAQKGTIGIILPEEDMPFTGDNPLSPITPDIIQNPHATPSRMTMGQTIEIVASKVAAITGERVNATSFEPFDINKYREILKSYGFSEWGVETMYSGITGQMMENQIFTGPCYFQALKHHAADKIQARGVEGAIERDTRQPISGKQRGGGGRFGEMEVWALIASGASYSLYDRLMCSSDAQTYLLCEKCGSVADFNVHAKEILCQQCGVVSSDDVSVVEFPHAYKKLMEYMRTLGINIKIYTDDLPTPYIKPSIQQSYDFSRQNLSRKPLSYVTTQFNTNKPYPLTQTKQQKEQEQKEQEQKEQEQKEKEQKQEEETEVYL